MSLDSGSEAELQPRENQYGEILLDKSKLFHGIGFDTLRLKGILEHGILSETAARGRGMNITRNYGGYNLNDSVSMVESPAINNTFTFGAFRVYIKEGISFVVGGGVNGFKPRKGSAMDSGFIDEAYVFHGVPRSSIEGVMVPEDALSKPISELPLGLSHMGYAYIDNRCRVMVAELEKELGYQADTASLEELIKQKRGLESSEIGYSEKMLREKELVDAMEKVMQAYIGEAYSQNMGKDNVTQRDVITRHLPEDMKVYNSDGYSLDIKKEN